MWIGTIDTNVSGMQGQNLKWLPKMVKFKLSAGKKKIGVEKLVRLLINWGIRENYAKYYIPKCCGMRILRTMLAPELYINFMIVLYKMKNFCQIFFFH